MQSKVNIFHSLQHASDSEDENDAQKNKAKKIADKKEQRARPDEKNKSATANRQVAPGGNPERQTKEEHARTKAPYKAKTVTEEAHPQDRHSGHGNQAYGGKPKKSGVGKGNWGNYKEDRKGNEEQTGAGAGAGEGEDGAEDKPQEEEKPAGITLSEYYQQHRQAQNEPQVNETKAKITSEQLTKELGTATALKTRSQQQVDDRKVGKKKDRLDVNHHAAINSEYANLLNFRTGFVEKEYKQRGADELPGQKRVGPRTGGPRERENAKEDETQPQATEGQTAETQPVEGQTQQTQEGVAEVQTPTQTQGQGQNQDNQNRRRYEGQRGGRGGYRGDRPQGDRPQGDRPQGDRPQGDRPRKQHGGKDQGKINFEDESAFPKLG